MASFASALTVFGFSPELKTLWRFVVSLPALSGACGERSRTVEVSNPQVTTLSAYGGFIRRLVRRSASEIGSFSEGGL